MVADLVKYAVVNNSMIKGKFIMKYLALLLLVLFSDANAYNLMNDIHEERMLTETGDESSLGLFIVTMLGIIFGIITDEENGLGIFNAFVFILVGGVILKCCS